MNKNCLNCKYLEYEHDDSEYSSTPGYHICNKREETEELTAKLQSDKYLNKSKVCYIAKSL